ncbi:MAG: hypothetical protein ACI9W2_001942 [Gammaproteobacteria bacterium]|jgi:hypothetical protein
MLQHMAVKQPTAGIIRKKGNFDFLSWHDQHGIGPWPTQERLAVALGYLEVVAVQMHWMGKNSCVTQRNTVAEP